MGRQQTESYLQHENDAAARHNRKDSGFKFLPMTHGHINVWQINRSQQNATGDAGSNPAPSSKVMLGWSNGKTSPHLM